MTPTARTLKHFRDAGHIAAVVEKWNPHARIRQDLFGVIDILVMDGNLGLMGVQACAGASHAARRKKAMAEPRLKDWLVRGLRFEVISWAKQGPRGKRKTWTLRREAIGIGDLI